MATMRVFSDEAAAMKAAQALMEAGVSGNDIHIIHAPANYGGTQDRIGTFGDEDAQTQREGTFDDEDARTQREGSFDDTSGHRRNVREEPQGSFADTEGLDHGPRHSRDLDTVRFDRELTTAGIDRSQVTNSLAGRSSGVVLVVESSVLPAHELARLLG